MLENLLFPMFICVGVESLSSTRSSFSISFSINFPLRLELYEPQIILCELKSPTSIKLRKMTYNIFRKMTYNIFHIR